MITPWEIYWVLQLDSIGNFFGIAFAVLLAGMIVTLVVGCFATDRGAYPSEAQDKEWSAIKRTCLRILIALCVVGSVASLLPSTKTAAAMIIVPKIVNSPTIQHEAGDLYNLAKQALRDAIAPKPSK
jgi:hypothetical protein